MMVEFRVASVIIRRPLAIQNIDGSRHVDRLIHSGDVKSGRVAERDLQFAAGLL